MSDFFLIARISSVVGTDGFVKIELFSDFPDRFLKLKKVFIDFFNDKKELKIQAVKKSKDSYLLKFENFDSNKEVDILVGKDLLIEENDVLKLPVDYAFIHDIIGSVVLKNDTKIGEVTDMIILNSNNVYVIKENNGNELLIPAINDYVEKFDSEKKILILKPIENIYDEDES